MRLSDKEKKQLVVYDTRKEQPSIWNLQAFVIVFLFIMLGTTINVYSVNNDNLTWVDSNGDFKLDSYDHSMINLDTNLVELNNQSLNDVFLDAKLTPSTWFTYHSTITQNTDEIVEWTSTGQSVFNLLRNLYNYDIIVDDIFYVNGSMRTFSTYVTKLRIEKIGLTYVVKENPVINVWYDYSFVQVVTDQDSEEFRATALLSSMVSGQVSQITKPLIINMTDLGIDNLTQVQMDAYYDLYVSLQENRIEAYKDLGNEPISQWQNLTQILSDIMDAVAGPISDTIDWIDKFMFGLFS